MVGDNMRCVRNSQTLIFLQWNFIWCRIWHSLDGFLIGFFFLNSSFCIGHIQLYLFWTILTFLINVLFTFLLNWVWTDFFYIFGLLRHRTNVYSTQAVSHTLFEMTSICQQITSSQHLEPHRPVSSLIVLTVCFAAFASLLFTFPTPVPYLI